MAVARGTSLERCKDFTKRTCSFSASQSKLYTWAQGAVWSVLNSMARPDLQGPQTISNLNVKASSLSFDLATPACHRSTTLRSSHEAQIECKLHWLRPRAKLCQHVWHNMLRSFVHHVGLCCMVLAYDASSLKPVKLFAQYMPTFILFSGDRWARWFHSYTKWLYSVIKSIVL